MDIKLIVGNQNIAKFTHAIAGVLYYQVLASDGKTYQFPIDMNDKEDVSTATFDAEIKAITIMRYIRLAKENEMLIEI